MSEQSFDPFGEKGTDMTAHFKAASTSSRAGVASFWFIVIALVAVRAFYFG
jgi:hypothetical protein